MSRIMSKKTQVPCSLAVFLTTLFLSFASLLIHVNEADAAIALRAVSPVVWGERADIIIQKPAGTVENDVMIMVITDRNGGSAWPTGWTQIASLVFDTGGNVHLGRIAWKRTTATEGTSYTVTSTENDIVGAIASFSGVIISGSPIDVTGTFGSSSTVTVNANSITPTVANTMVIFTSHVSSSPRTHSGWSGTNPTFTEGFDQGLGQGPPWVGMPVGQKVLMAKLALTIEPVN